MGKVCFLALIFACLGFDHLAHADDQTFYSFKFDEFSGRMFGKTREGVSLSDRRKIQELVEQEKAQKAGGFTLQSAPADRRYYLERLQQKEKDLERLMAEYAALDRQTKAKGQALSALKTAKQTLRNPPKGFVTPLGDKVAELGKAKAQKGAEIENLLATIPHELSNVVSLAGVIPDLTTWPALNAKFKKLRGDERESKVIYQVSEFNRLRGHEPGSPLPETQQLTEEALNELNELNQNKLRKRKSKAALSPSSSDSGRSGTESVDSQATTINSNATGDSAGALEGAKQPVAK